MTLKIALLVRRVRTYKLPTKAMTIAIRTRKTMALFPVTGDSFLLFGQYHSWVFPEAIEDP
jgi:hypothetical protein